MATIADVLVVGAGPAGTIAALNLAPRRRVLLVERDRAVGARIGEALAPAARRLLADMGLLDSFAAQGHAPCHANRSIWGADAPEFFVLKPANGQPASHANGGTVSFAAPSRAAVDGFHKAALAAGAKDEGAVGPRSWHPTAYAGYCRDLDGNKLAAYCFKAE